MKTLNQPYRLSHGVLHGVSYGISRGVVGVRGSKGNKGYTEPHMIMILIFVSLMLSSCVAQCFYKKVPKKDQEAPQQMTVTAMPAAQEQTPLAEEENDNSGQWGPYSTHATRRAIYYDRSYNRSSTDNVSIINLPKF